MYLTIEKYYSIRGYLPCTPTSIYNAGIFTNMTAECSLYLLIVPRKPNCSDILKSFIDLFQYYEHMIDKRFHFMQWLYTHELSYKEVLTPSWSSVPWLPFSGNPVLLPVSSSERSKTGCNQWLKEKEMGFNHPAIMTEEFKG